MLPFSKNLILASQSPRRSQLLKEAGFAFTIKTKPIDESFPKDMPVREVAPYLAREKALAAKEFLVNQHDVLLTADSVVILGNRIFNKPANASEAKAMLHVLSGHTHEVITGVCLLTKASEKVFAGYSKVSMEPLRETEIDYYVNNWKPFDKAGSYAIQEWIGLCKISKIEGTYTNIMGLPMDLVYRELMALG